jgi:hypothetical protein
VGSDSARRDKKAISEGQSDEDRAFLHDLHEKKMERDREREAQAKIRSLAEKRKHPGDSRARSVAGALFSDGFLADAIELRLRDNLVVIDDGRERRLPAGEFRRVRILEPEDVVTLYVFGLTLEQGGLLRLHEPDRGLSTISDIPAALARLRRNQLSRLSATGTRGASGGEGERSTSRARLAST